MEWRDSFNRWYETHFKVGQDSQLTPNEVINQIADAMEASQVEGLDGLKYVANKYVLELAFVNEEERAYLLSFIDEQMLTEVVDKTIAGKNYSTRGPLDFTIEEVEGFPGAEKLHVRALFDKNVVPKFAQGQESINPTKPATLEEGGQAQEESPVVGPIIDSIDDDLPQLGTPAAWAALLVESSDGRRSLMSINKPVFTIGRSRHGNNDLVLSEDGLVSKRHVRIEMEPDGSTTLYDLASTNGTFVNGQLVPVNISLKSGDVIEIGQTHIQFQRDNGPRSGPQGPTTQPIRAAASDATTIMRQVTVLPDDPESLVGKVAKISRVGEDVEFAVGNEAIVGRAVTCDIVIGEPTVSSQQARMLVIGGRYVIQDLSGRGTTIINGRPARVGERVPLNPGDRLSLGGIAFNFELA